MYLIITFKMLYIKYWQIYQVLEFSYSPISVSASALKILYPNYYLTWNFLSHADGLCFFWSLEPVGSTNLCMSSWYLSVDLNTPPYIKWTRVRRCTLQWRDLPCMTSLSILRTLWCPQLRLQGTLMWHEKANCLLLHTRLWEASADLFTTSEPFDTLF